MRAITMLQCSGLSPASIAAPASIVAKTARAATWPRFCKERILPALLEGLVVGGGMALFATWTGFDPLLIGGLSGAGSAALIARYPQG